MAPTLSEDRAFDALVPNRKWIADFTYIWTAEGWLYVAAVVDLFSRRMVGRNRRSIHSGTTPPRARQGARPKNRSNWNIS